MLIFHPVTLVIFIFGAIVGSFLNVCILRIPKGESVIHPPSHCPNCKAAIAYFDNIPFFSYLILRGRCRACRERISPRYFAVELLTASLTVALFYKFGLGFDFLVGFVFVAGLIVVSCIDFDHWIIPDVISLPGIILGLSFSIVGYFGAREQLDIIPSPISSLIGIMAGGGILWVTAEIYEKVRGREGMGGGDIKLFAMIGAFLGWASIPVSLLLGSLTGSVFGLVSMVVTRSGFKLDFPIPFGPFLCTGAVLYLFFSNEIIEFYLSY